MSTEITIHEKMDKVVARVLGNEKALGFKKAQIVSTSIVELRSLLTDEYMKPIMALQGNKLGFKCDKSYPVDVVRDCLIEAVFMGLQPYGNEFNIIAGNCYPTKEGLGSLLKKIVGLTYQLTPHLPRINKESTSAAVKFDIDWSYKGSKGSHSIEIPIRMNRSMGTDAVIGKGTRKARKWLYDHITGNDIPEGSVEDIDFTFVQNDSSSINQKLDAQEKERIAKFIESAKTQDELKQVESEVGKYGLSDQYILKFEKLKK